MPRFVPRFKTDPGLLVALLLATFAAWPFLTRHGLPTLTDAELHVYRTFEVMTAWQAGAPYPRWAPDLFYAFGYPIFHYYAPLTYHLGAAYGWWVGGVLGGGPIAGMKFVLVAAPFLGAVGMYLFVRDEWGRTAGLAGASAFVLAPYVVYIDPHARGAVPETFAMSLGPLMFWVFARLRRDPSPGNVVIAAAALAALTLSHNLMAFVFTGLLVAWLAWEFAVGIAAPKRAVASWNVLAAQSAAILLGMALSAFMWLPAVLERDAVQFTTISQGYFDFHQYFIPARELFAPSQIFDFGATQPRFHYNLGLAQWVLAGLGALTLVFDRARRRAGLFFAFAALGLIFLMTEGSVKIWEGFSPLTFLQFPTRLLGPAALALGVLAGASVRWAEILRPPHPWARPALGALAAAACAAAAMPLLYPPPWGDFGPVNPQRLFATEREGRGIGTTSGNEFLPVGVKAIVRGRESLWKSYDAGPVDKLDREALPASAAVVVLEHGPQHDRWRVMSPETFVLRTYTFYWPGWTAYVDGVETRIEVSDPEGWITFQVPSGAHDVLLKLEDTPPRTLGWSVSGLALLGLLALSVRPALSRRAVPIQPRADFAKIDLEWRHALVFGLVILAALGVRYAADQSGWWRVHSTGSTVLVAQHARFARLERGAALLAFDLPQTGAHPGGRVPVTLYWKALAPLTDNLRVFVHFIGPDGLLWGQSDKWNPADYPMVFWPLDKYVRDEHLAVLQPDAPPGMYTVRAGLYTEAGVRMRVLDSGGDPSGEDGVTLTTTFVVQP